MRRYNPAMSRIKNSTTYASAEACTYKGILNKIVIYTVFTLIGVFGSVALIAYNPTMLITLLSVSGIVTFISGICALWFSNTTKISGAIYCLFEGLTIGFLSLMFEAAVAGTVLATLVSTITLVLVISVVYFSGLVKVNGKFAKMLISISIAFILSQLIMGLLSLFGVFTYTPQVGMLCSIIMIVICSLYLIFDIATIHQAVQYGAPKELEWYCAFGLVYTVLWIFVELLPIVASLINDN